MDEIKSITREYLQNIAAKKKFNQEMIIKDYYVTLVVYLLKDIGGIYFKGGTALHKIFLQYERLSEDADYTITKDINEVKKEIEKRINNSGYFEKITKDKHVKDFVRLIAHYTDPFGNKGTIFIDLNKRAKLMLTPETYEIKHFYTEKIPPFSVTTLNQKEMLAEKVAATIGRNKPRDHFDVYQIIKRKMPIDLSLVKKKCESSGDTFDITKMFNNAKKLKNRWDEDMIPLLAEEIPFQDVMKTLAKYFKYAEKKEEKKLL